MLGGGGYQDKDNKMVTTLSFVVFGMTDEIGATKKG